MKGRQKRQPRRSARNSRPRRSTAQRKDALTQLVHALLARLESSDGAGWERARKQDPLLCVHWDPSIHPAGLSLAQPGVTPRSYVPSQSIAKAEAMELANWSQARILAVVPLKLSPQISIDYVFFSPGNFSSA